MPTGAQFHQFTEKVFNSPTAIRHLRECMEDQIDMAASIISIADLKVVKTQDGVEIQHEEVGDYMKNLLNWVFNFIEDPNSTFRQLNSDNFK